MIDLVVHLEDSARKQSRFSDLSLNEIIRLNPVIARIAKFILQRPYRKKYFFLIKLLEIVGHYDEATQLLLTLFKINPDEFVILGYDKDRNALKIAHLETKSIFYVNKKDWLRLLIEKNDKENVQ
jgi:hypothetical protein